MPLKFNAVGVYYCTRHHGVMNEDEETCDFADDDLDERKCERRRLGYLTRRATTR